MLHFSKQHHRWTIYCDICESPIMRQGVDELLVVAEARRRGWVLMERFWICPACAAKIQREIRSDA